MQLQPYWVRQLWSGYCCTEKACAKHLAVEEMNPNHSQTSIFEARDLSIGYRSPVLRRLFTDLNLSLEKGSLTCLLGANGSGKSTLLRTLAGLQDSISGSIFYEGDPKLLRHPSKRAKVFSVVLTDRTRVGLLKVRDFVALGRYPHTRWTGSFNKNDHEQVDWAIDCVNADSLATRFIHTLSDGEYQRVVLARALAQQTPMILLDEPTAFLDLPHRIEIMQILKKLVDSCGLTLLMSTHDLDLALEYANCFWLIRSGGSYTSGFPEDLLLSGKLETYLGGNNIVFDRSRGTFRAKMKPLINVQVRGENAYLRWTQNVLEKNGIGVSELNHIATVKVECVETGDDPVWLCQTDQEVKRYESFEQFDAWCKSLNKKRV
jgi:iron complex transport system ATP-binding protein